MRLKGDRYSVTDMWRRFFYHLVWLVGVLRPGAASEFKSPRHASQKTWPTRIAAANRTVGSEYEGLRR